MDELLRWCRAERERMLDSVARMEAGQLRLGENRSGLGLVDQTKEWIDVLKGRIRELDDLLATYAADKRTPQ